MKNKLVNMSPLKADLLMMMFKGAGPDTADELEIIDVNTMPDPGIVEEVKDAAIILGDFTFHKKIDRDIIEAAKGVKLIQQPSVGYQHINIDACIKAGIPVANTAGANTIAVAEHTIMSALCLLKHVMQAHKTTMSGEWRQMDIGAGELFGKTWGIIGMGRIGKAVAERLIPFGVRILYFDSTRLKDADEKNMAPGTATLRDCSVRPM